MEEGRVDLSVAAHATDGPGLVTARWRGVGRAAAVVGVLLAIGPAFGCKRERGNPPAQEPDEERAVSLEKKRPPPTLPELAREVGLTFPPSARLLGASRESGMDDYLQFKVELDAKDLPPFLASLPMPAESFRRGDRGFLGADEGYWDPHRAPNLRTAQAILPGARALNVGVSDGVGAGKAALYIVNHGT